MTLNLNTWQRMTLLAVVNNVKGDLRTVQGTQGAGRAGTGRGGREAVGLTEHPTAR